MSEPKTPEQLAAWKRWCQASAKIARRNAAPPRSEWHVWLVAAAASLNKLRYLPALKGRKFSPSTTWPESIQRMQRNVWNTQHTERNTWGGGVYRLCRNIIRQREAMADDHGRRTPPAA